MMSILSLLLACIFFLLSGLHFGWAMGLEWGLNNSLPTNQDGVRVLQPGRTATVAVGLGLLAFGLFYLLKLAYISITLPSWVLEHGGWLIISIFLARSVGDFTYVGFFKGVKDTGFAKMDTRFYVPLCLFIGLSALLLQLGG